MASLPCGLALAHDGHGHTGLDAHETPALLNPELSAAESRIRELLAAHPELKARLAADLQFASAARRDAAKAALIQSLRPEIESASGGHEMGASAAKAKVTVVTFFDYHCGSCKRAAHELLELVRVDSDVRLVFKEWPMLGADSRTAARAALAARAQGRYAEFHSALMSAGGLFNEPRVLTIAQRSGLDVQRLSREMQSPALDQELDTTIGLSATLGLKGTPAFFVNGELLEGRNPARLRELIARARITAH